MNRTNLPVVVDAVSDLAFHPDRENESWYVTAFVTAGEHRYGLLAHHLNRGVLSQGATGASVSVTGETLDFYTRNEVTLPAGAGLIQASGIDIRTEVMTWTGDADAMKVEAQLPEGGFELSLRTVGPVLYNMGSGCFAMFGEPEYRNYQMSFPYIEATGALTLNGRTEQITGSAWFDRQWGPLPELGKDALWIWMNFVLPDGERISLWDTSGRSRNTWGTILAADGVHTIVEATMSRDDTTLWRSPESGQRFATRWTVTLPCLQTEFDVAVAVARQELLQPAPRYEGLARFTGVHRGEPVKGLCYVETGPVF